MKNLSVSRRGLLAGTAASVLLMNPLTAHAANVVSVLRGDALKWQGQVIDLDPLKKFYRGKFGNGIWTEKTGLSKNGKQLVQLLQQAGSDGLDPSDYLAGIPGNVNSLGGKDLASAELLLSQAFWRFGRDLSAGRTTPAVSEPDIVISRKKADVTGWLKIASRKGPKAVIDALRPSHEQYLALRKALANAAPGSGKARQIIVNMERWRWLPSSLGKRYVLVNQAAFEMLIRENDKTTDRRRVVVGTPYFKTPMFSHAIQYAEFNPTWTVPRSIAGNEMLPKLRKDPGYLERNNYKVYTSWKADAPAMNPHSVDWNSVNGKKFPYRIEQQPGDNNALGRVKFLFPNRFNVYLHDTQSKNLFSQSQRAFSHGCIRVENPMDFADKLFGNSLNMSKIKGILANPATQRVKLRRPVPVHLAYFTAWVENGKVSYHKDVYGRDKLVANILFGQV